MRFFHLSIVALSLSCLWACEQADSPQLSQTSQTQTCSEQELSLLMDNYHSQWLELYPLSATYYDKTELNDTFADGLSDHWLEQRHQLNQSALTRANQLNTSCYSENAQIGWDEFVRARELDLIEETFPSRLLPFTQFDSAFATFIQFGSGDSAQPFATLADFAKFRKRAEGFAHWADLAIARMKEGIENDVTLPRVLAERVLEQLQAVIQHPEIFMQPIQKLQGQTQQEQSSVDAEALAELERLHRELIEQTIVPAFSRMTEFIKTDYLKACRASDGYWGLPNGRLWYKHYVNTYVDDTRTIEEIHQLGLNEVHRIHQQMKQIGQQLGIGADLHSIFHKLMSDERYFFQQGGELVHGYMALKQTINPVLANYFSNIPQQDYVVKEVEAYRAASEAGASYQLGSRDGSRPGIFYINTYNLKAQPKWGMMTLSLHEASPGHHFQSAHQLSMKMLSEYQTYANNTAFDEGWALYAEYLGLEMGLFNKPLDHFGKLSDELLRAMRLVVDTGLHDKGWSREQAIQYMQQNSPMATTDIVAEVERYMALPGQAVSYKLGEQTILQLRRLAEKELGDQFDIKAFHEQVLKYGSVSMPALRKSVLLWLKEQQSLYPA